MAYLIGIIVGEKKKNIFGLQYVTLFAVSRVMLSFVIWTSQLLGRSSANY